jgi:hypothetical protein
MENVILVEDFDELAAVPVQAQAHPQIAPTQGRQRRETDIKTWLESDGPRSRDELKDLRYCLYHRCSRAGYKVNRRSRDYFRITGRQSTLFIISNAARHFLLWRLRKLSRRRGWSRRRHHLAHQ